LTEKKKRKKKGDKTARRLSSYLASATSTTEPIQGKGKRTAWEKEERKKGPLRMVRVEDSPLRLLSNVKTRRGGEGEREEKRRPSTEKKKKEEGR